MEKIKLLYEKIDRFYYYKIDNFFFEHDKIRMLSIVLFIVAVYLIGVRRGKRINNV